MKQINQDDVMTFRRNIHGIATYLPALRDVAERKARVGGANLVPSNTPRSTAGSPVRSDAFRAVHDAETLIRDAAAAAGFMEAKTPGIPLGMIAKFLTKNADVLAQATGDGFAEWVDRTAEMRCRIRSILNPPDDDVKAAGTCPICGGTARGVAGADVATCGTCHAIIPASMLHSIDEKFEESGIRGTAKDLSTLMAAAGIRIPVSTIRVWAHRGRLQADNDGLYALSDVLRIWKAGESK